ncbi:MAG TPA: fibrobacter succinogenes major paralogous domain-containing protein, partial [Bacteroidales bacterium]|nr:fibrobacter succinogenes major paralogous domain-containing protein [Bacteroidales bacterium]
STPTGAQLIIDDKSHGATPQTVTLVFGNHNVKLVNGKKVVNEAINIAQNGRTSFSFDVSENTFTDKRDGKTYKTVKIGSQIWMAENLNYKTTDSYCYDNNEANCQKYGRLYTWKVAKSACPSGWHLPSKAEFETLLNNYGGENSAFVALKEGGNSGFNDLFGGFRKYGDHYNQGSRGYFWSSSEYNIFKAWYMNINSYNKKANMHYNSQSDCRSVRCVQD